MTEEPAGWQMPSAGVVVVSTAETLVIVLEFKGGV